MVRYKDKSIKRKSKQGRDLAFRRTLPCFDLSLPYFPAEAGQAGVSTDKRAFISKRNFLENFKINVD